MAGPAWLADSFAALMLLTALYCAGRLVLTRTRRRPTEQDVNLVHVLMGVAMAGMLAPRALPLSGPAQPGGALWAGAWSLVFGAATVWFAARIALSYRATGRLWPVGSHHLPHLIMSGTMVYMLATVTRPAGPAVHFPLLALILAQFMVGYVMWAADRLPALARVRAWRPVPAAPVPAALAPAAVAPAGVAPTALDPVPALASHPVGGPASTPLVSPSPAGSSPGGPSRAGSSPGGPSRAAPSPPLSLRLASCCNIVMGLVMGYMLIISL